MSMRHAAAFILLAALFVLLGLTFVGCAKPEPSNVHLQCCTPEGRCGYPFSTDEPIACAPGTQKIVSDGKLVMPVISTEISSEDFYGGEKR